MGLAFLFVPINTLVYVGRAAARRTTRSRGIVNLSRNMGGDIGIAFVTTLIARRAQMHQVTLSAHTTPYDPAVPRRSSTRSTRVFEHAGAAADRRRAAGDGRDVPPAVQQATQLAYLDALFALGVATALMVPLVWLANRASPMGAPMGH